jgi:segregation and condensation protein A
LEARDLLFARLLQYRAFKEVAGWFATQLDAEAKRHPRTVALESKYIEQTPPLQWTLSCEDFRLLAVLALTPNEIPTVGLAHLHAPLVSIREQAAHVIAILKGGGQVSFRALIAGVTERGVIVARFLAVLELYRESALSFHQVEPLGELWVQWTANNFGEENLANLGEEWGGEERHGD